MPLKVLLVESESSGSHSIKLDLLDLCDHVLVAPSPHEAPSRAKADWPDLIIVNACCGQINVRELCEALDETELESPRIIVSHDTKDNHASGEVYLPFPFSVRQLMQRIKRAIGDQKNRYSRVGDIALDRLKRQVQRPGRISHLTPKEFRLLHLLMQNAGEVLDRGKIMKDVWETSYLGDTRTLDVHIRWVREKLEDDPSRPKHIITVRGVGYRFYPKARQGDTSQT